MSGKCNSQHEHKQPIFWKIGTFFAKLGKKSTEFHWECGRISLLIHSWNRPVYIESCVCVVKEVVKCSFEYLCVVHRDTCCQHNVGVGEGTIKKNS